MAKWPNMASWHPFRPNRSSSNRGESNQLAWRRGCWSVKRRYEASILPRRIRRAFPIYYRLYRSITYFGNGGARASPSDETGEPVHRSSRSLRENVVRAIYPWRGEIGEARRLGIFSPVRSTCASIPFYPSFFSSRTRVPVQDVLSPTRWLNLGRRDQWIKADTDRVAMPREDKCARSWRFAMFCLVSSGRTRKVRMPGARSHSQWPAVRSTEDL